MRANQWLRRGAAFALGVLLSSVLPEPGLWTVALFGLVPIMYLIVRSKGWKQAALYAWLGGIGFFMAAHYWLAPKVGPFLLAIGVVLGALWMPWGIALQQISVKPTILKFTLSMLVVPSAWTTVEFIRAWEHLGGPWGLLGTSQWNSPLLTLADFGGVWLLSFLLVAMNVALTWALIAESVRVRTAALFSLLVLGFAPFLYRALRAPPVYTSVATVVGAQAGDIKGREPRFSEHERLTLRSGSHRPDLVVWGESSVGFDAESQPEYMARLVRSSRQIQAPLLVNVDARRRSGGILKSALLVNASGPMGRYDKMRLVPFGEYIPMRRLFGWITSVSDAPGVDRLRGDSLRIFDVSKLKVGPLICFESAFPDLARALTSRGADLIVVQSATTTFQESWAPEQHASLAAVRAVETGRSVVHATLSGVSSVFDPSGRRLAEVLTNRTGTYVANVPIARGTTPFVRFGDWVPWGSIAIVSLGDSELCVAPRSSV